jgi:hypothetical protein
MTERKFNLGDLVKFHVNSCPFKVIGLRDYTDKTVEIEGDFSGGTHNVTQSDWVHPHELILFKESTSIDRIFKNNTGLYSAVTQALRYGFTRAEIIEYGGPTLGPMIHDCLQHWDIS